LALVEIDDFHIAVSLVHGPTFALEAARVASLPCHASCRRGFSVTRINDG
jgi:hypothetical protein